MIVFSQVAWSESGVDAEEPRNAIHHKLRPILEILAEEYQQLGRWKMRQVAGENSAILADCEVTCWMVFVLLQDRHGLVKGPLLSQRAGCHAIVRICAIYWVSEYGNKLYLGHQRSDSDRCLSVGHVLRRYLSPQCLFRRSDKE